MVNNSRGCNAGVTPESRTCAILKHTDLDADCDECGFEIWRNQQKPWMSVDQRWLVRSQVLPGDDRGSGAARFIVAFRAF